MRYIKMLYSIIHITPHYFLLNFLLKNHVKCKIKKLDIWKYFQTQN